MQNKQYYCVKCERCKLDENANTNCGYEEKCESRDPEDSMSRIFRPYYIPNREELEKEYLFYQPELTLEVSDTKRLFVILDLFNNHIIYCVSEDGNEKVFNDITDAIKEFCGEKYGS